MPLIDLRQNRDMAVSKRTALGTGFGVITGLLVLSTVLAYHIQESFSERSVAIHRHFVQEQDTVTNLRRLLYMSGTTARDYLLNPNPNREAYLKEIQELKKTTEPLVIQLRDSSTHTTAVSELERNTRDLWLALESAASQTGDKALNYSFIQREIAPRRTAAGQLLQELEAANRNALTDSEKQFSASRSAAASSLMWLLAFCLLVGIAVAWFSLQYYDHLEQQAAARFEEVLKAKLELERLSNRLMEIQEEERTRLSRELHDEIVQNLAVLKIDITEALARVQAVECRESAVKEALVRAKELADRTVATVRNISLLLRPSLLDDLGLGPALQWHTDDFTRRTRVPCKYVEEGLQEPLPDAVNTCVYRVVQEALRNCEKHSQAKSVDVHVKQTDAGLIVEVRDDGVGFSKQRRSPASLGVLGMRERAASLNGELSIVSTAGQGTAVRLELPLNRNQQRFAPVKAHA
jgi:signal transduction histidine kinase